MVVRKALGGLLGAAAASQPEEAEAAFLKGTIGGIRNAAHHTSRAAPKASRQNLMRARQMFENNVDPRLIYEETGFFRGADGMMRYEVPDSPSENTMSGVHLNRKNLIDEAANYPSVEYRDLDSTSWGYYSPAAHEIHIDNKLNPEQQTSTLAHELQHAIQERGGFARGSNPESIGGLLQRRLMAEQRPYQLSKYTQDIANSHLGALSTIDSVARARAMAESGNLTGKRRLLVNQSDWYKYGDEIRRELGPEPKGHRPKAEREEWLRKAWHSLADKQESGLDEADYATLFNYTQVPRGKAETYLVDGLSAAGVDINQLPALVSDKAALAKEALGVDPKLAEKQIKKIQRVLDSGVRDEARIYREIGARRSELGDLSDYELYKRTAGEVEARNVQARLAMTPEARYESYPLDTEDVPRGEQIIVESPLAKAELGTVDPRLAVGIAGGSGTAALTAPQFFQSDTPTGGMGVRVPPAPVEPAPLRAAMPLAPTTSEKAQGVLDAIVNMGQAAVAPISNAPHTLIQALTSDRPTAQVRAGQQQRLDAMDYQPGELGQQYTDDLARLVADQINQSQILDALGNSRILRTPINAIQQLPDRARLVGGSILDALPL